MYRYLLIIPAVLIISVSIYIYRLIRLRKTYKKYLNIPAPVSGIEAASMMMQREGYNCQFAIYKGNELNPFKGNFYLPDRNLFVMRREIMDGKNLLSLGIGCQLAAAALRYKNGDIGKEISTIVDNEYALKYIFKKEELEQLDKSTLYIRD